MKGGISLKEFIADVKKELIAAQAPHDTAFLELQNVELEVAFTLDTTGEAKARFIVVDVGADIRTSQVHRVKLCFKPLPRQDADYVRKIIKNAVAGEKHPLYEPDLPVYEPMAEIDLDKGDK
ncbi:hypothetical protein GURASL_29160 [Geotalea uraniireducens]|uniref:Trypsin-co-occurring domain-containing protein n=1 Tax=Geotalea uraniireducens TaxID=351604 RepID=A0ABN6VUN4_9BACT|nr:trypco2 family protein [Geotalea uraniireducens]BDV43993.1 hypothetical protein GURASL_29160 [Geotalea uraniireducens]